MPWTLQLPLTFITEEAPLYILLASAPCGQDPRPFPMQPSLLQAVLVPLAAACTSWALDKASRAAFNRQHLPSSRPKAKVA